MANILLFAVAALSWRRAPRLAWSAAALFWIALGWGAASLEQAPGDASLLRYADQVQRTLSGDVVAIRRLPQAAVAIETTAASKESRRDEENAFAARDRGHDALYSLDLKARAIEDLSPDASRMVPVTGGVRLLVFARNATATAEPPCGARVRLIVRLRSPQRYLDPGVWQYAQTLALRGMDVESSADAATLQVEHVPRPSLQCRLAAVQRWSADRLHTLSGDAMMRHLPAGLRLNATDVTMLNAMLLGDRTQLSQGMRLSFERTGSFHLFVVAGVHVALLLGMLYWLLLRFRLHRWLAAMLAIALATAYALMTGFGAPVQRALAMSSIYLLAELIGRERNPLNSIGIAALGMMMMRPATLAESGFQMTLLSALAIAGIALPLAERTVSPYARALRDIASVRNDAHQLPRLAQRRVSLRWVGEELAPAKVPEHHRGKPRGRRAQALPAWLVRMLLTGAALLLVTLVTEMVMALPMAAYFHRATPFAAPANLLALPLTGVLMGSAIITFAASLIHPTVAILPAALTAALLHAITYVIGTLSSLRGADVRIPTPLAAGIVAALALWAAAVFLLRGERPRAGWAGALLVPFAVVLALWPRAPQLRRDTLEFTAIDVGQGDSLLVASPERRAMLIDAGGPTGSASVTTEASFDIGEQVVSPYLWSRGIRRLDVLALTHAHSDHIGGMAAVLRNFAPRELWISVDADTPLFRNLIQLAAERGVVVRHLHAGDELKWSGTTIRILNPSPSYQPRDLPTNDDSLALRIAYGEASVLAEGDAEHASENQMLTGHARPVTLLKVGHHGSNTSTQADLLEALHPRAAVISCGLGNRFGHPRMPVLQRLQAAGVLTSRTDRMGAVQYLLHADGSIDTHIVASEP